MWWGSQAGMWVWLVVAWVAWLALAPRVLALARALPRLALGQRWRLSMAVASGVLAVGAAGAAASSSEQPDEHAALYRPIAELGSHLTSMFAAGETVALDGRLDVSPMPIKPALRYLLVRNGVRVLSRGAYQRLGDSYELDHRSYDATVYVGDRLRPPAADTRLVARARYVDGWGPWTVSVWVRLGRPHRVTHEPHHLEVGVHS
jgi:hypothetical protein